MATRTPLYNNNGNLQEMTTAMVDSLISQAIYQYSLSPSSLLSVVASGGNMGTIADTRLQAGASSTAVSSFPGEATTAEPSVVTVNYTRLNSSNSGPSAPSADTGKSFPVYQDCGDIKAMTLTDMKDTFFYPAINLLASGSTTSQQGGTYHIATSTSVTGSTLVSSTPVFIDTRANTAAYTAGGIPETLDQPTTINNYYLHRVNGSLQSYTLPLFITSSNDVQEYSVSDFDNILANHIRYYVINETGYRIGYSLTSGTNRGSGMADTRLNGSGNYQTRLININDYRAQEFPDGTPVTQTTTFLKITKT